jgi:hypothetical protein
MTLHTKDIIIKELAEIPDDVASEILEYIRCIKIKIESDKTPTHILSESSLKKDWLNPIEDDTWKDL